MPDETVTQDGGTEQTTSTESQTTITEQDVTLDDVYKTVQFDQPAQTQQAAPIQAAPVQQQPAPSSVPDPYDTENFKAYIAQQAAGTTALQQAVANVAGYLSNIQRQEAQAKLNADIQAAVETVNKVVGYEDKAVIEAMIDAQARKDPQFKRLFETREKNPQAWQKALTVVAKDIDKKLSVRVDPRLRQANEARRLSQGQMATTTREEPDESWNNLSSEDFQRRWERTISGGNF